MVDRPGPAYASWGTLAFFLLSPTSLCLLLGAGDSAVIDSPGSAFLGLQANEGDAVREMGWEEVPERGVEAGASSAKVM